MKKRKIKICIVEDESILLRNMKKKIQVVSDLFEVTAEAFDGREALEKIRQEPPDIVFTDIRMPVMDGLELARILHREYADIFVVIVSGYDDFEYARTALKYGVSDYLMKPLQPAELQACLHALQEPISARHRESDWQFLENWVNGTQWSGERTYDTETWQQGRFSLFLVNAGNLHINRTGDVQRTFCMMEGLLSDVQAAGLPFKTADIWDFPGRRGNLRLFLLEDLEETPKEAAQAFMEALQSRYPQVPFNLAYTEQTLSFQELYQASVDVYRILEMSLVIGRCAVLSEKNLPTGLAPAVLSVPQMQQMQAMIASGNAEGFQRMVQQMFRTWEQQGHPQQWVNRVLVQVLNVLQRTLSLPEESYERMNYETFTILEESRSLGEAGDAVARELAHHVFSKNPAPGGVERIIDEMDAYIHQHYTETINLANLAEKYHFNQSYLTRVFKKQKGIAPLKLINMLRIDRARKLLLDTDLSVREISEMLGFSNQHYFSRIFKEFTDLTPMEYRMLSERAE